jgi:hypothetical protein
MTRPNGSGQSMGKSRPPRVGKELEGLQLVEFTDELDQRVIQEPTNLALEIRPVRMIDLSGDHEGQLELLRNRDGEIRTLLGRHAAEERQVASAAPVRVEWHHFERQSVVYRRLPIQVEVSDRSTLGVADRH